MGIIKAPVKKIWVLGRDGPSQKAKDKKIQQIAQIFQL
jgi:hypothetical protein